MKYSSCNSCIAGMTVNLFFLSFFLLFLSYWFEYSTVLLLYHTRNNICFVATIHTVYIIVVYADFLQENPVRTCCIDTRRSEKLYIVYCITILTSTGLRRRTRLTLLLPKAYIEVVLVQYAILILIRLFDLIRFLFEDFRYMCIILYLSLFVFFHSFYFLIINYYFTTTTTSCTTLLILTS